jgi:hypothetical protein
VRQVNPIKRGRAAISHKNVNDFFSNFYKVSAGVLPENIQNYDEINLQENPGGKTSVVKRRKGVSLRGGASTRRRWVTTFSYY